FFYIDTNNFFSGNKALPYPDPWQLKGIFKKLSVQWLFFFFRFFSLAKKMFKIRFAKYFFLFVYPYIENIFKQPIGQRNADSRNRVKHLVKDIDQLSHAA